MADLEELYNVYQGFLDLFNPPYNECIVEDDDGKSETATINFNNGFSVRLKHNRLVKDSATLQYFKAGEEKAVSVDSIEELKKAYENK